MTSFRRPHLLAMLAILASVVLAACGSSPTETPSAGGPGTEASTEGGDSGTPQDSAPQTSPLEAVYAELEGLEGEEYRARLVELAEAEAEQGGGFSHYTSMNLDNSGPVAEAFADAYDIDQELYRATGSTIVQRVIQEADAGYAGSDVVSLNGTEISLLADAGVLAPLQVSVADDLAEVTEFWASNYLNVFIAAWNTDIITDPPTTWVDVLTNYEGQLSMELGDFDWFSAVVQDVLMEQEGMSEEEAIELVREAASNAYAVDGHTVQNQLLATGEFGLAASVYLHNTLQQLEDGAPLAWNEPAPVQPLIVRSNGIGINIATDRPATALLFVEFVVNDAQEQIAGFGRTPANRTAPGGIPAEYDIVNIDIQALLDQEDKWRGTYDDIMSQAKISGS